MGMEDEKKGVKRESMKSFMEVMLRRGECRERKEKKRVGESWKVEVKYEVGRVKEE